MKVIATSLPEVLLLEPDIRGDSRGFFMELYHRDRYVASGVPPNFVQDNLSRSTRGVLRGLHLQNPRQQGKLVTVFAGSILDIAVDVRVGSPRFGQHTKVELSETNRRQLWVPKGFAHGFLVLSSSADFFYKCDELYSPGDELVVRWDDPDLAIDWGYSAPTISERDGAAPALSQLRELLPTYNEPD